jgi:uncharacterized membrane protein YbhN (UPF0104 family)
VLVALAFLGVDIVGGLELMFEAKPGYLIAAFAVFCLALFLRMVVWLILARSLKLGYRRLSSYVRLFLIGWSAGLGLPRGASPLARAAVLAADKRSVGRGVVVDIADRLIQVATYLLVLVVAAAYLSAESTRALAAVGIGLAIVAGLALVILPAAWLLRPLLRRLLTFGWLKTFVEDVRTAAGELRRTPPNLLATLFVMATAASLLSVTALFLTSRSLDVDLSFPALMAAFAAISLTVLFPISINGLGPREGILTAAVAGAGLNSEAGVALGLLWFVMQAVTRLAAATSWFVRPGEGEEGAPLANKAEATPG